MLPNLRTPVIPVHVPPQDEWPAVVLRAYGLNYAVRFAEESAAPGGARPPVGVDHAARTITLSVHGTDRQCGALVRAAVAHARACHDLDAVGIGGGEGRADPAEFGKGGERHV